MKALIRTDYKCQSISNIKFESILEAFEKQFVGDRLMHNVPKWPDSL